MTIKTKKGIATISITLAMSIGIAILGGLATFYNVKGNTDKEISRTNERVSVVETQTTSILKGMERLEQSNAEIIRILMQQ